MSMIRTEHVSKKFGSLEVLKDINLTVENGEVICIIGPLNFGSAMSSKCSPSSVR